MEPYFWSWYASKVLDSVYSGASKLIDFIAVELASKCVGSTAGSASGQYIGSTASGSECISTAVNRSN
jgi:hypothetical protein